MSSGPPCSTSADRMDAQFVQALYTSAGAASALNYWLGQLQTAEATLGDANKGKRGMVKP